MSTIVFNKNRFMAWVDKNVAADEYVMMTLDLAGTASVSKKRNEKRVSFGFAADCFKREGDIGHIAFRQTPCVAFVVCKPEDVSEGAKKILEDSLKKKK